MTTPLAAFQELDPDTLDLFDLSPEDLRRAREEADRVEAQRARSASAVFRLSQADPQAWADFVAWLDAYTDQEVPLPKAAYGNLLWRNAQRALFKLIGGLRQTGAELASRSSRQEG